MDILDELNKTIKEKNEEWNYTPKREKSETDALIDRLLIEFSSESKPGEPIKHMESYSSGYNRQPESYERQQYNNSEQPVQQHTYNKPVVEEIPIPDSDLVSEPGYDTKYVPKHEAPSAEPVIYDQSKEASYRPLEDEVPADDDHTRVFSREDIEREQERMVSSDDDGYEHNVTDMSHNGFDNTGNDINSGINGGFDDDYYDENDFEKELGDLPSDKFNEQDRDEFEEFIEGQNEDQIRVIKPKEKKKTGKRILRILGTAVIAAFTIIGIFSSVVFCLEKLEMMPSEKEGENESMSDELADVIQPFVMTSVDDFDSPDKISNEQLINLAIWEIVMHGDIKFFKDDESDKIVIPNMQIELAAEKLLGETKEIEPKDIAFSGLEIKYESEKEGYVLPDNYYVLTTYAEVTGVTEENGVYAINVSCYRDTPHWMNGKKSSPVKKMTFTLKKVSDHYQVLTAITV